MKNALATALAVSTLVLLGAGVSGQAPAAPPRADHVILITIDGMRGDYIGQADLYKLKIPNMRRMIREGSYSERAIGVFPSLTGPSHTSLVTGVGAARHGILGNNQFAPQVWQWDQDSYDDQPAYSSYSQVKVPSLWTAARAKGLKTAAVSWPQTAGGPIDYILNVGGLASAQTARAPWLAAVEAKTGTLAAADASMGDHMKALGAAEIFKQFKPAFMAIHFANTDGLSHEQGPGTPNVLVAMEEEDANVGIFLKAVADSGLAGRTTVIVTGDHGHLNLHTQLAINLPLVEAGLITKDAQGHPVWRALIAPNRGLGSLYLKDPNDKEAATIARKALETYAKRYPRRFRILERTELDEWWADSNAVFGIEPYVGYLLDARLSEPFAMAHNRASGHGYRPDTPGMETGLIMSGFGVRKGVFLPSTLSIDVAPTIALLLGLDLPNTDGKPIVGGIGDTPLTSGH